MSPRVNLSGGDIVFLRNMFATSGFKTSACRGSNGRGPASRSPQRAMLDTLRKDRAKPKSRRFQKRYFGQVSIDSGGLHGPRRVFEQLPVQHLERLRHVRRSYGSNNCQVGVEEQSCDHTTFSFLLGRSSRYLPFHPYAAFSVIPHDFSFTRDKGKPNCGTPRTASNCTRYTVHRRNFSPTLSQNNRRIDGQCWRKIAPRQPAPCTIGPLPGWLVDASSRRKLTLTTRIPTPSAHDFTYPITRH